MRTGVEAHPAALLSGGSEEHNFSPAHKSGFCYLERQCYYLSFTVMNIQHPFFHICSKLTEVQKAYNTCEQTGFSTRKYMLKGVTKNRNDYRWLTNSWAQWVKKKKKPCTCLCAGFLTGRLWGAITGSAAPIIMGQCLAFFISISSVTSIRLFTVILETAD